MRFIFVVAPFFAALVVGKDYQAGLFFYVNCSLFGII